jgi:hypothetical protein
MSGKISNFMCSTECLCAFICMIIVTVIAFFVLKKQHDNDDEEYTQNTMYKDILYSSIGGVIAGVITYFICSYNKSDNMDCDFISIYSSDMSPFNPHRISELELNGRKYYLKCDDMESVMSSFTAW